MNPVAFLVTAACVFFARPAGAICLAIDRHGIDPCRLQHGQKPPQDGLQSLIPLCENEFETNLVF
jgi:hypothetical protein